MNKSGDSTEMIEVCRETLMTFLEWTYHDSAIDSAPSEIRAAENDLWKALGEDTDANNEVSSGNDRAGSGDFSSSSRLFFELHGVDNSDLPDDAFEVGADGYPRNGCDHLAHEMATDVHQLLQENYSWTDDIDGVSLGVGTVQPATQSPAELLDEAKAAIEQEYNQQYISLYDYGDSLRLTDGSASRKLYITAQDGRFEIDGRWDSRTIEYSCSGDADTLLELLSGVF